MVPTPRVSLRPAVKSKPTEQLLMLTPWYVQPHDQNCWMAVWALWTVMLRMVNCWLPMATKVLWLLRYCCFHVGGLFMRMPLVPRL